MTSTVKNAALYFHDDGFDPVSKELNGRRVAGASFLRGFLEHLSVNEVGVLTDNRKQMENFRKLIEHYGYRGGMRGRTIVSDGLPEGYSVLNLPGPVLSKWAWRRRHQTRADYSLCGVTHTTATSRILNGLVEMRTAPVEAYDGVIVTSRSVHSSISWLMDEMDDYVSDRHSIKKMPKRFQMPVIPLGIHTKDFEHDPKARKHWRKKLGIGSKDCLVITVSRLNSFAKFDPLPMFQALEIAAKSSSRKVHFLAVGPYSDQPTTRVFENGARICAPSVTYHHVDGTVDPDAHGLWSAADVFTLPVDNIQETFGLAPVEAMAAGLPVVVSDWDGFRDTVPKEAGYRIKTLGPKPGSLAKEGLRYYLEADSYVQYLAQSAFQTVVDVREMSDAFAYLFENPKEAVAMGKRGQTHARNQFDWSQVIPQYQSFWAELDAIREHSKAKGNSSNSRPIAPDPSILFESYATKTASFSKARFEAIVKGDPQKAVADFLKLRETANLRRMTASQDNLVSVLSAVQQNDGLDYDALKSTIDPTVLDRALLWLLKYNFVSM